MSHPAPPRSQPPSQPHRPSPPSPSMAKPPPSLTAPPYHTPLPTRNCYSKERCPSDGDQVLPLEHPRLQHGAPACTTKGDGMGLQCPGHRSYHGDGRREVCVRHFEMSPFLLLFPLVTRELVPPPFDLISDRGHFIVFFSSSFRATANADGVWKQTLPPTAASSTPRRITFSATTGENATMENVLFGDVYLCGGQSNM